MIKTARSHKMVTIPVTILSAVTLILLSGCSTSPNHSTGKTSQPTSTSTSTTSPSDQYYGDVIPAKTIKDAYGTYESTTIDPKSPIYTTLASSTITSAATTAGWTNSQMLSGQQWTLKFVAEQTTDSIALDGTTGWAEWQKNATKYISGPFADSIINVTPTGSGSDRPLVIFNNPNGLTPTMVRDGKPRLLSNKFTITKIDNVSYQGQNYLSISGTALTRYRVTDAAAIASVAKQLSISEADVKVKYPIFTDGKINVYDDTFTFRYNLVKTGSTWSVGGYNTNWNAVYEPLPGH